LSKTEDRRRHDFFIVDNEVIVEHGAEIGPHGIAVYCALVCHAGADRRCHPSLTALAREVGMSRKGVAGVLKKLEKAGLVGITRQHTEKGLRKESLYVLRRVKKRQKPEQTPDVTQGDNAVTESAIDVTGPDVTQGDKEQYPGKEQEEKPSPNGEVKKKRVGKLSDADAERRWRSLCEADPNGEALEEMAEQLAAENSTGQVAITRVWRELGKRYSDAKSKHGLTDAAWEYGFEQALSRGVANIGYVLKCSKGHRQNDRPANVVPIKGNEGKERREKDYDWLFTKKRRA
jgi:DNA-binding MarR family transcriptional regulator